MDGARPPVGLRAPSRCKPWPDGRNDRPAQVEAVAALRGAPPCARRRWPRRDRWPDRDRRRRESCASGPHEPPIAFHAGQITRDSPPAMPTIHSELCAEVGDGAAVGRPERIVRALRVGEPRGLDGVHRLDPQLARGGERDEPAVRREREALEIVVAGRVDEEADAASARPGPAAVRAARPATSRRQGRATEREHGGGEPAAASGAAAHAQRRRGTLDGGGQQPGQRQLERAGALVALGRDRATARARRCGRTARAGRIADRAGAESAPFAWPSRTSASERADDREAAGHQAIEQHAEAVDVALRPTRARPERARAPCRAACPARSATGVSSGRSRARGRCRSPSARCGRCDRASRSAP